MSEDSTLPDLRESPPPSSNAPDLLSSFRLIAIGVAVLWGILFLDYVLPIDLLQFGLQPRSLSGALGIVTMPLLHNGIGHLMSNTIPLVMLLALLVGSRVNPWRVILEIVFLGGGLLWIFGRSAMHVGASGLVYGLIAYLLAAGYWERRPISIVIALFVLFFLGGALLWGVLPTQRDVSWDGHLTGAVAGGFIAWLHCRRS